MLGPDHLASLLPCIIGQPWGYGAKIGLIWGFGHGITSIVIGMVGFSLKDYVFQTDMNYLIWIKNIALGGTLLVIGTMGVREAFHSKLEEDEQQNSPSAEITPQISRFTRRNSVYLTYLLNGCIMGLTWDGLPSLAPSVALPDFPHMLLSWNCTVYVLSLWYRLSCKYSPW